MRLFIPEIGHSMSLEKDWSFLLQKEQRNIGLWDAFNLDRDPAVIALVAAAQEAYQLRAQHEHTMRNWIEDWLKTNHAPRYPGQYGHGSYGWLHAYEVWIRETPEGIEYKGLSDILESSENLRMSVTLPKGTVLRVDRIYIRKGALDYSSITFLIDDCDDPRLRKARNKKDITALAKKKIRFWASLTDVNMIEIVDE